MEKFDAIVVGAGPAGILAAGRAAETGSKVLLLEKMNKPGNKLVLTGKGRCNITNDATLSEFIKHIYPNGRFLKNAFSNFFSEDIIALLNNYGVETTLERGGRYFPSSNKSTDVLRGLNNWLNDKKVEIRYNHKTEKLIVENNTIKGIKANGEIIETNNVILATGGKSYPATGSTGEGFELAKDAGHSIVNIHPSLVPLETVSDIPKRLEKLSLKNVTASVWINNKKTVEEFGEMVFTNFGLSGPIILTLSRSVVEALQSKQKIEINIDLKPALDDKKLDNRLLREFDEHGKKKISNVLRHLLPSSMIPVFTELTKLNPDKECHQISSKERKRLRFYLKNMTFHITGHRPFKEAIITAGGISTKEISAETMESKIVKGLYFAGEIIDLDAETGGYNLQIAFSTGWLAGNSCKTPNKKCM
ncbi:MAG: NAD(P)/FAD-dependent oxidoreductase [Bacteroidales bacterium]